MGLDTGREQCFEVELLILVLRRVGGSEQLDSEDILLGCLLDVEHELVPHVLEQLVGRAGSPEPFLGENTAFGVASLVR